jgi:hypothetical protein
MNDRLVAELVKRAEALLDSGTLVWAPGETVAYAFVVPCEARNDLADVLADIQFAEDDGDPGGFITITPTQDPTP